jgi:hypothetical protein
MASPRRASYSWVRQRDKRQRLANTGAPAMSGGTSTSIVDARARTSRLKCRPSPASPPAFLGSALAAVAGLVGRRQMLTSF